MSTDKIWIDNFQIIFNKPIDFFPTRSQTNEERLNAIVRLSLYISITLSIYHSNVKYASIFVFVLFLTYIIYNNHPDVTDSNTKSNTNTNKTGVEKLDGTIDNKISNRNPATCTKPTVDNPFMNFTMKDYMTFDSNGNTVDRQPACDPSDPNIKKLMDAGFDNNLYKDVSDIFGKMNSQRNYFTMPSTSIVNSQDEFANWLYKSPQTCKENQNACQQYEDIRSNRFVFPDPTVNPVDSKKLQK
jgi:hypothetical protein